MSDKEGDYNRSEDGEGGEDDTGEDEDQITSKQKSVSSLFNADDFDDDKVEELSSEHQASPQEQQEDNQEEQSEDEDIFGMKDEESRPRNGEYCQLLEMPYEKPPPNALLYYSKVAGFNLETKPFDGKTRNKKFLTTARWKYFLDENGEPARQSNARFVQWSDGSWHLFVGKEAFDVSIAPFKDYHQIFARHPKTTDTEDFLQFHATLKEKLSVTPRNASMTKKAITPTPRGTKRKRQNWIAVSNDPGKEKLAKQLLEEKMIETRQKYGKRVDTREISAGLLEDEDDLKAEEEKEKEVSSRLMAAKKGLEDSEDSEFEEDEEIGSPSPKKSKK